MHRPSMRSTWRTGTAAEVLGLVGTRERERASAAVTARQSPPHRTPTSTQGYGPIRAATERLKCVRSAQCAVRSAMTTRRPSRAPKARGCHPARPRRRGTLRPLGAPAGGGRGGGARRGAISRRTQGNPEGGSLARLASCYDHICPTLLGCARGASGGVGPGRGGERGVGRRQRAPVRVCVGAHQLLLGSDVGAARYTGYTTVRYRGVFRLFTFWRRPPPCHVFHLRTHQW